MEKIEPEFFCMTGKNIPKIAYLLLEQIGSVCSRAENGEHDDKSAANNTLLVYILKPTSPWCKHAPYTEHIQKRQVAEAEHFGSFLSGA